MFFPQTGLPVGFSLRKKIDWTRCWARWAWLGADLALLGALGCGSAGARWLGWAWCWACCGLGVGFGCAGRAGWVTVGWLGGFLRRSVLGVFCDSAGE